MILLALLYLSFGSSFALPTPSDIPIDISPSLFARSVDKFGTRSLWNIIWSCLSTIFTCSWIAVHPNIPAPKDSQWAVFCRRVAIMGHVLIAPEMVIAWAARQHFGAKHFAKKHQNRGWTMTHGFFIIMGGFTLHDKKGTALRILEPVELERLSEAGEIEWPSITEAEIQDRSKGDYLSKAIVLAQMSWFIAQCIARGAYRLEVTELEVATVAYAVLTGFTYYLWWKKPLDVRCSIPVYLLKDDEKEDVDFQGISSVSPVGNPGPVVASPLIPCDWNSNDPRSSPISEDTQIPQQPLVIVSGPALNSQEPRQSESSHDGPTASPESHLTGMQQLFAWIRQQRQRHGTVLGLANIFFFYPLLSFFIALGNMLKSESLNESIPLRVPTFYSPKFTDYNSAVSYLTVVFVAVIFGAIHCIAWSLHFPSLQERLAWRISAASIAGLPILYFVFVLLLPNDHEGWWGTILDVLTVGLPMSYVIARIVLLVLPCIALRALPPTALVDIQWAAFFPHIH